jgi:hypothetical protein
MIALFFLSVRDRQCHALHMTIAAFTPIPGLGYLIPSAAFHSASLKPARTKFVLMPMLKAEEKHGTISAEKKL